MRPRYLFGPVDCAYADDNLHPARQRGECLTFHATQSADLPIRNEDTWHDVAARFPAGWSPDFVALMLPYSAIPDCLWHAPIPVIGLAGDWHLLWHRYRDALPRCDLVVTDTWGVERLRQAGHPAVTGNLFGCARSFLDAPSAETRDIDVLFVGSLHPAEQRERLPWLRRLAIGLGARWTVAIRGGIDRAAYQALLGRSRIVFNRSVRRECNLRAFEAASMGALLFQEAENMEVGNHFRDGQECVFYTADTLGAQLSYYLENERERRRLADAARERLASGTFSALWDDIVARIGRRLPDLAKSVARRVADDKPQSPESSARLWESLCCHTGPDRTQDIEPPLIAVLRGRLAERPTAEDHAILGLAIARQGQRQGAFDRNCAARTAAEFRRAVALAPDRLLLRLNLVEALWRAGEVDAARHQGRLALAAADDADDLGEADLNGAHYPPAFDTFRVEWERAAWTHAGDPRGEATAKLRLLRWRLCSVLAALSGELAHYRRSVQLRDDLWTSHAALGRALLRAGCASEAAHHLRRATGMNPFDTSIDPDLLAALDAAGDRAGRRDFVAERELLTRAAPFGACPEIRFAQEVVR